MKKAKLIPFQEKKNAQIEQDVELGPHGRFLKMFDLIALSIMFLTSATLKKPIRHNVIVLKRKNDTPVKGG